MPAKKKSPAKKKPAAAPKAAPSQFFTEEGGPWGKCFLPRAKGEKRYWLVKSEPDVFSWTDLLAAPAGTTHWNGVRNYSARNFMTNGMQVGDLVFFYHSNDDPQAIHGICEVASAAYPDPTQFDKKHDGYDEKATLDKPIWFMIDLRAVEPLPRPVTLQALKANRALAQMAMIRTGRLSVIPLTSAEWDTMLAMSRA